MTKLPFAGLAILLLCALPARADSVTFSGTSGTLSAGVSFTVSGNNLVVTLTNTSAADVLVPANVLTAVFFSISGNPSLTRVSAIVPEGNQVLFAPSGQCTTGPCNVGGEWAYARGLSGAPLGANSGISSSGLGVFGPSDIFPPAINLQGPLSPGGLQYGITSAGDNPNTGNSAVAYTNSGGKHPTTSPASNALIQNVVVFTLAGLPPNTLLLGRITSVSFQYGTALDEPNVTGSCITGCTPPPTPVPEPGTLALFTMGLPALGSLLRRRGLLS